MQEINILLITNCYPPKKYASSPQIGRLSKFLRTKFNVKVVTIDTNAPIDESLLDIVDCNNVFHAKKNKFNLFIDNLKGNIIKKNIFPDLFYLSHFSLYKESEKIAESFKVDVIFTFGMPMSTHIVGLKLKKKYPHLKWISVFNDPWVDNAFADSNFFTHITNKKYQNKVFEKSNTLVFNSKEYIDSICYEHDKSIREKIKYVPLSYSDYDVKSLNNQKKDKFIIRYLGNFYGKRQPYCLFEALKKIPQKYLDLIQIELIGTSVQDLSEYIKKQHLEKIVFVKKEVSYLESIELMHSADLLLVIDAPSDLNIFLPSKLVEYIGANKPIFAITSEGTSKKIITEMGFLVANPNDIEDIVLKLSMTIELMKAGNSPKIPDSFLNSYSIESVGNRFLELIKQLI